MGWVTPGWLLSACRTVLAEFSDATVRQADIRAGITVQSHARAVGIKAAMRAWMPHPLRYHPRDGVFEVVHRTIGGEFSLRPSAAFNERVEAVLARAQRLYGVEIHNYNFQVNHPHLIGRARDLKVRSDFLKHVFRNIGIAARQINGGSGPIWSGRPKIRLILDEEAEIHRMRYVCANGVKEGLVASPTEWPGASAARALVQQRDIVTVWRTASERRALERGEEARGERNVLRLTPIAAHARLTRAERRQAFRRMFDEIAVEGRKRRNGRPPLGAAAVLAQNPRMRHAIKRRGAPLAFSTSADLRREFDLAYYAYCASYRGAAQSLREGELAVPFPPGSLPPPRPLERRGFT